MMLSAGRPPRFVSLALAVADPNKMSHVGVAGSAHECSVEAKLASWRTDAHGQ